MTPEERLTAETAARDFVGVRFGPALADQVHAKVRTLPDAEPQAFAHAIGAIAYDVLSRHIARTRAVLVGLDVMRVVFPNGAVGMN